MWTRISAWIGRSRSRLEKDKNTLHLSSSVCHLWWSHAVEEIWLVDLEIQLVVCYVFKEVQRKDSCKSDWKPVFSRKDQDWLSTGDNTQSWVLKVDILGRGKSHSLTKHALSAPIRQKKEVWGLSRYNMEFLMAEKVGVTGLKVARTGLHKSL